MSKRDIEAPDLQRYAAADQNQKNQLLLDWLSDDGHRATLYGLINDDGCTFEFYSRDAMARECDCAGLDEPQAPPRVDHRPVSLITNRDTISRILRDDGSSYSNRIYAQLGGGSFMLALDPSRALAHTAQKEAFRRCFPHDAHQLIDLSRRACQAASITSLRASDFDLAQFAEQSALRYCQKLLGFAMADFGLLETTLRAGYAALVYQVMGRHFVTDPTVIPAGKQAMARLLTRTAALIDAYAVNDTDLIEACEDTDLPPGFEPVLKELGLHGGDLNGEQRAVIALGAAIGTVGNVQAAACIAVKALFADKARVEKNLRNTSHERGPDQDSLWARARSLARSEFIGSPTQQHTQWKAMIQDSLRQNPPIPFLPRLAVDDQGRALGEVLLALGGGTQQARCDDDPLIWGLPKDGKHWCAGQALAWPLIAEIVRQVMALPGLAEALDAQDATPIGLKKRWGFACESYPLTHRRDRRVAQASLNVAMRLKSPVKDNADRVREVIRSGAPRIEQALREARHVHFAWFELIESDTVLVLHTVYDGPFEAYIQDFALKVGVLFDQLFECIEDPPPRPVKKFPNEFVAHIQRYNRRPAMGYFFSAYPHSDVASIIRDERARP